MSRSVVLRVALVLLLTLGFGLGSTTTAPPGTHIGYMWPIGLASGALIMARRRMVPYVAALLPTLAFVTFVAAGYPAAVSAGYGIAVAVEAVIARQVLVAGPGRRMRLLDISDLGRFALACMLGAVVAAAMFSGTSALTGFGTPWEVAVAVFVTHLASQAVLLGLFRDPPLRREGYGNLERVGAWLFTLGACVLAFTTREVPSLAFIVIPPLAWVAYRAPMREAMTQLAAVAVLSTTLTASGLGPFSDPHLMRLDPEFEHLPQQVFLIACAMVTIPFAMAVAMQRRSADQVMRERARTERLVQSARGIAIIGTDDLGRITLFSPSAEAILGYTAAEVFGQSTRMFHTDAELARHARELDVDPTYVSVVRASATLEPGTAREWQFVRKDGTERTLSTILSPVTDDAGRLTGYVATGDDITDRIHARQALEKALDTERRAVKRLTEVDQVKDIFISSVSHELRTPITNIVGYLELLQDGMYGDPSPEQHDAMTRIDQNSRRLLTLIDDLLTLSSLENMDGRRRNDVVDMLMVTERALEIVRPTMRHRDLLLDVRLPPGPLRVVGDPSELERLVINLTTNAVKFTPDGGRITVEICTPEDGRVVLEVRDTGIGIAPKDQARLFGRFFRTDHAHVHAVPGSGLGLSIAKAITELHGGTITGTSAEGAGSTFRVELPLASSTVTASV
ncbi:MAG: PAS domain S-box protein [Nocardioidaceae bacterium]|nr:PAS domain S-box protein [Nocardioidaceae bacterium]